MEYLLRVKKAVAETEHLTTNCHDYAEGWIECQEDLTYGISLGSDHAVMQQIKYWTDPLYSDVMIENKGDVGYADRMKEIHKLLEGELL